MTETYAYDADGTGLLDYYARMYDPSLGRFISPDSIIPSPGNPQSLNRYSYVQNNPLKYTDPTGHCEKKSDGNPDISNDAKAACWNWYYDIKKANGWGSSFDPEGLWTWGNDAMAHLHWWVVTNHVTFTSDTAQLDNTTFLKGGLGWTANDIGVVINALDAVNGYLSSNGFSTQAVLGVGGSGSLRFNKVEGAGLGFYEPSQRNRISISDPAGFGRDLIIHEIGHLIDHRAGLKSGYSGNTDFYSDRNWTTAKIPRLSGDSVRESYAETFREMVLGPASYKESSRDGRDIVLDSLKVF